MQLGRCRSLCCQARAGQEILKLHRVMLYTVKEMGHHADCHHYSEVIMDTMASQITSLMIVYSTIYSGADERQHQGSVSLAFVRGIHGWRVNSPHKGPVTWKMFPFDDVIMIALLEGLKVGSLTTFNANRKTPCRRSIKTQLWVTRMVIKPDQRNPWIKDQLWNNLLSTILHLQLPNFVSCGRDKPSHMTQNLVTVGVKL